MPNINYDSGGSGSYTTLTTALAAVAATDEIIFVKSTSNEVMGANTTYTASASFALPGQAQRLYSVDDFTTPDVTTGGKLSWTGSFVVTFAGNWYIYGMTMGISSGGSVGYSTFGGTSQAGICIAINCTFTCTSSNSSTANGPVQLGPTNSTSVDGYVNKLINCTISFGHSAQSIRLGVGYSEMNGITLTGTAPTSLLRPTAANIATTVIKNSDLSGVAWTNLINNVASTQIDLYLSNCKMPASFNWYTGSPSLSTNITAVNCTSGDNGISLYKLVGVAGTVQTDSTIYASSEPITDSGISLSYLMTTFSTCGRSAPLTQEFLVKVDTDTSVTPYVEILVQGDAAAALKTTELYIEVEALSTDGSSLGVMTTTHPGLMDAGTTDCPAGTISYTGDGYATERTHKITGTTFTTRQDGFVKITVFLAKPSVAIHVGQYGI